MKKLLLALSLVLVGLSLFLLRPWSPFNPLAMNSLFAEGKRLDNFRHMERIFPSQTVKAGNTPFAFEEALAPLSLTYAIEGEERHLEDFLQKVSATGLLVIKDDRIVYERYLNGGTASSLFTSWSVAKSFVSTLVGMALGDGLISSLDDPIDQYVPELAGSGYVGVPIRHVLQMSSGVDFDETYNDRFSDIQQFFVKVFVLGQPADQVVPRFNSAEESGRTFHYISLDTQALGMLVRRVFGRPLVDVLSERVWQPLGMEADAFWNVDSEEADATAVAFCCLNARLRDYAKLGRLYLQDGVWNGQRLLPKGWVQTATTPGGPIWEPGASPYGYGPRGYGFQWWVPNNYQREYFAAGVWGQYIYVSEPDNLIIVRSSADPNYGRNMAESIAVFRAIRDAVNDDSSSTTALKPM